MLHVVIFWILLVIQAPTFIWVLFWIHFVLKLFLFFINNILRAKVLDEIYNEEEDDNNELF